VNFLLFIFYKFIQNQPKHKNTTTQPRIFLFSFYSKISRTSKLKNFYIHISRSNPRSNPNAHAPTPT